MKDEETNRGKDSEFIKKIIGWSLAKDDRDYRYVNHRETPYIAKIRYSLVYIHEHDLDSIQGNWVSTDEAGARFKTEAEAREWLEQRGCEL